MRNFLLIAAALALLGNTCGDGEPAPEPEARRFMLMGQSNMARRASTQQTPVGPGRRWLGSPATQTPRWDEPIIDTSAGRRSPWARFAQLQNALGPVELIVTYEGGTCLLFWDPIPEIGWEAKDGVWDGYWGVNYRQAYSQWLASGGEPLTAVLYLQGECDAAHVAATGSEPDDVRAQYQAALDTMVNRNQELYGVPTVLGLVNEASCPWSDATTEPCTEEELLEPEPGHTAIRQATLNVIASNPNAFLGPDIRTLRTQPDGDLTHVWDVNRLAEWWHQALENAGL